MSLIACKGDRILNFPLYFFSTLVASTHFTRQTSFQSVSGTLNNDLGREINLVHYLEEEWPAGGVHLGKSFLGLDRVLGSIGFFRYGAFDLLA